MALVDTSTQIRLNDLKYLAHCLEENQCCALVGLSNMGKSTLLRRIRRPEVLTELTDVDIQQLAFFYVDFNLQLEMNQQGFYELILRTVLNGLRELHVEPDLIERVDKAYRRVVEPTDDFQNALSFNEAIIALCENWSRRLVFLFDEFDEVYQGLSGRVFLNLRALRDKYEQHLMYVVVVGMPLSDSRYQTDNGEFAELFAHNTHNLKPFSQDDVAQIVKSFAADHDMTVSDDDLEFAYLESGGHPGLLEAVCQIIAENTVAHVTRDRRLIMSHIDDSDNIRTECAKLWNNIAPSRQKALMKFVSGGKLQPDLVQLLLQKGLLVEDKQGDPKVFGQLFEDFIRRQQLVFEEPKQGILIDIESGEVYIDGKTIEPLTSLEYRLLLLLYGNIDKICDKYRIVEAVWGEDYIEEVDDARIEKLVSRLRQKIEPNPSEPSYLITVRGRGYRLQNR